MSPRRNVRSTRRRTARPTPRRGGFALVPALFLVVVLGALGLIAIRVGGGEQQTVTMGVLQVRALSAANSGIEWGAYEALSAGTCASSTTLTLTEGALNGFSVLVTCTATAFTYNSLTNNSVTGYSYVVQATATSGTYGAPGYVRRVVSGTFTSASPGI